jgi:hypothetical protein
MVKRDKGPLDVRPMVEDAEDLGGGSVRLTLKDLQDKNVRLDEIARAVFGLPASALEITRVALYGLTADGQYVQPHDEGAFARPPKKKAVSSSNNKRKKRQ